MPEGTRHTLHRRYQKIDKRTRVNDQIRISPIRLIQDDGEQIGIVSIDEARERATVRGMDLVEVAAEARPPVVKMMDYGKYKYEKKKKANKNTAHSSKTKEVRLRPKTGKHDIDFKVNQAKKFLEHKDKVQITVQFRGREMAHQNLGMRVLEKVRDQVDEMAKVEQFPKMEGRQMVMVLSPKMKNK